MRYLAGCRCRRCRDGNAAYERKLEQNRRLHGPNDLVPTDRVREHLRHLQQFGMGHKTVAKHGGVGKTVLAEILWYGKRQMRRRSALRVLAVQPTLDTLPKNTQIPAAETVGKIRQLIRWGYPKALINRDGLNLQSVGMQVHSLRGKTGSVTVKTAIRIQNFFVRIEQIRSVWQKWRGPIPHKQYVYWKKNHGSVRVRDLELRSLSRAYDYHYLYPPSLKSTIRMANRLKRVYRKRRSDEKHNRRPAQSPIRHN